MVRLSSLSFCYSGGNTFSFPDLKLAAGESLLILGASGIGKTTLMHLMAGLLEPRTGSVEISGVALERLSGQQRDRFRGKNIGLVFQRPHFIKTLTLLEHLLLIQNLAGVPQSRSSAINLLHKLSLDQKSQRYPHTLSQGEQQRAGIAMALINSPRLLLADEPTASLDDVNAEKVIAILKEQSAKVGAALVIITHDSRIKAHISNFVEL